MDPTSLSNWASGGPAWLLVGAVVILAFFRETKTIPNLIDTADKRADKDREAWAAQANAEREHNFKVNQLEREACERRHAEMSAINERRHAEVIIAVQTGRHATKDVATALKLLTTEMKLENDIREAAEDAAAVAKRQSKET